MCHGQYATVGVSQEYLYIFESRFDVLYSRYRCGAFCFTYICIDVFQSEFVILFKVYYVYRVTGQFILITYKVIIIHVGVVHHVDNVESVRMCTKCAQYPHSAPCLAPPSIPNRLALVIDFGRTDIRVI